MQSTCSKTFRLVIDNTNILNRREQREKVIVILYAVNAGSSRRTSPAQWEHLSYGRSTKEGIENIKESTRSNLSTWEKLTRGHNKKLTKEIKFAGPLFKCINYNQKLIYDIKNLLLNESTLKNPKQNARQTVLKRIAT